MNARQKAKKYKQQLEFYYTHPIKPQINICELHPRKIGIVFCIDADEMDDIKEYGINGIIARKFAESNMFQNAIKIQATYEQLTRRVKYEGTITMLVDEGDIR